MTNGDLIGFGVNTTNVQATNENFFIYQLVHSQEHDVTLVISDDEDESTASTSDFNQTEHSGRR